MTEPVELEIHLTRQDAFGYSAELRYTDPLNPAGKGPERGAMTIETEELQKKRLDPAGYGKLLKDRLLSDPNLREYFNTVRALAQDASRDLRLRLFIDRNAQDLHTIRWETLADPKDDSWLLARKDVFFSRFLSSESWERVNRRSKSTLRLLAVVSNPKDLEEGEYELDGQVLAPVEVKEEVQRLKDSLGSIQSSILASHPDKPGETTLAKIIDRLNEGFDILYLVCHGGLLKQRQPPGAYLWLENAEGTADVIAASQLVDRIKAMLPAQRPMLVVLASCQSAGKGEASRASDVSGTLAALGPQLAQAGVPAVLAMQGDVTMNTVASFMPAFFRTLATEGQVDRAVAAGRDQVQHEPDAWMPVLYSRLSDGRVWYTPGFSGADDEDDSVRWASLVDSIQRGEATALLGPGLVEPLMGPQRDIALRWAEKHKYPLSDADREDLPRVAQYLAAQESISFVRSAFFEAVRDELLRYYGERLPEDLRKLKVWNHDQTLKAMKVAAESYWSHGEVSPYTRLAKLHLPVYINANYSDLLYDALVQEGYKPQVRLCPWNNKMLQKVRKEKYIFESEPTPDEPLIYHLYGHMSEPLSLVITQDDYFDYLIGMTRNKDLIPGSVLSALTSSALLFLGFRMDDWTFRVLFRVILQQEGAALLEDYSHAAVQIEPEEGRISDAGRARRFLEQYFQSGKVTLFWGNSEDFLKELSSYL
jgi:hypothetical protein